MKKRETPETPIKKAVQALIDLNQIPGFHYRQNTGALLVGKRFVRFGYTGSADFTGILPDGKRVEIECKAPKGVLSKEQKAFKKKIEENNGIYLVVREVDDILKPLTQLGYINGKKTKKTKKKD